MIVPDSLPSDSGVQRLELGIGSILGVPISVRLETGDLAVGLVNPANRGTIACAGQITVESLKLAVIAGTAFVCDGQLERCEHGAQM